MIKANADFRFRDYREMSNGQINEEINRLVAEPGNWTGSLDAAWSLVNGLRVKIDTSQTDYNILTIDCTPEITILAANGDIKRGLCVLWLLWLVKDIERQKVLDFMDSWEWV